LPSVCVVRLIGRFVRDHACSLQYPMTGSDSVQHQASGEGFSRGSPRRHYCLGFGIFEAKCDGAKQGLCRWNWEAEVTGRGNV
jgi:hypothetical protein